MGRKLRLLESGKNAAPPTRFAWWRRDKRALKFRIGIMAKNGTLPWTFIRPKKKTGKTWEKCAFDANFWCRLWA